MIGGKTVLALIPARGGSKGVPRKNIREVAGKPLIAWTIEAAKQSRYIDRLIVSSDDPEIIGVAKNWGCEAPFVRPSELAQDDTPGIAPVLHALEQLPRYDYVVLLQPTSPLRTALDIDDCIALCVKQKAQTCVSVTEPVNPPQWMYTLDASGGMQPLINTDQVFSRRQDLPQAYSLNGAIYVADCAWLREHKTFLTVGTLGFVMPQERSLDIDTEVDLKISALLIEEIHSKA